ncbi:hypothetical protein JW887_04090 [Candidatus Dojkabacteria bacterium]|nr:hypothetical protein [Candidatus Dojkabacteria bacterium]
MLFKDDYFIFKTGHRIYANNGIIGISPSLEISEGYDGELDTSTFSPEDLHELATYMIQKWEDVKASISKNGERR